MLQFFPKSRKNVKIDPSIYDSPRYFNRGKLSKKPISRNIQVRGIDASVTEDHLFEAFYMFGEISKIKINHPNQNSVYRSRNAEVMFNLVYCARQVLLNRHNIKINGKAYVIQDFANSTFYPSLFYDHPTYQLTVKTCTTVNILFLENAAMMQETKEFCEKYGKVRAINQFVTHMYQKRFLVHCVEFANDVEACSGLNNDRAQRLDKNFKPLNINPKPEDSKHTNLNHALKSVDNIMKAYTENPDEMHISEFLKAHDCIIDYAIDGRDRLTQIQEVQEKEYVYEYDRLIDGEDLERCFPGKSKYIINSIRYMIIKEIKSKMYFIVQAFKTKLALKHLDLIISK